MSAPETKTTARLVGYLFESKYAHVKPHLDTDPTLSASAIEAGWTRRPVYTLDPEPVTVVTLAEAAADLACSKEFCTCCPPRETAGSRSAKAVLP